MIYIYIIYIIIVIKSRWQEALSHFLSLSFSLSLSLSLSLPLSFSLYHESFLTGLPGNILFPADSLWKSLLVSQNWRVYMQEVRERRLWFRPCFSSSVLHVFVLLEGFLKSEPSGRRAAVSCSFRYLFSTGRWTNISFHLTFSANVFLIYLFGSVSYCE